MANKLASFKIIKPTKIHSGTVLFFHGSGDTGPGVLEWIEFLVGNLHFPHLKFMFPTAPLQSYTPLNGEYSNVWFDRYSITPDVPEHKDSIELIGKEIRNVIVQEVDNGIPLHKIIVGGFSMGGALALHTAYRFVPGLKGVFALSSFLNENSEVYHALQSQTEVVITPLFMSHGDRDTLVPISWGKDTFEKLIQLKIKGDFLPLKNTMHELKKQELNSLFEWINKLIPFEP